MRYSNPPTPIPCLTRYISHVGCKCCMIVSALGNENLMLSLCDVRGPNLCQILSMLHVKSSDEYGCGNPLVPRFFCQQGNSLVVFTLPLNHQPQISTNFPWKIPASACHSYRSVGGAPCLLANPEFLRLHADHSIESIINLVKCHERLVSS
jgi:hypothetical protein